MALHISIENSQTSLSRAAEISLHCQRAKELEEAGEFSSAREALAPFWKAIGERPDVADLADAVKADLLLRAGTLTGWLGSARQVAGAQEIAKDLISESASIAERIGSTEKQAEATIDLGICYWREGALDEARVTIQHALQLLGDLESEQRLRGLLNSAIVEQVANRYQEALRIFRSSASLFDKSTNESLKGKFHNSYALCLKNLGIAKDNEEFIDNALVEFAAARIHFEEVGHKRFLARVENNEGFLFASLGKFTEAHQHLDRARALHISVGDHGSAAGVDDTRAQTLLLEGKNGDAERVARSAVNALSKGGEQAILAEALTTHGKALARLDQSDAARRAFDHAIEVGYSAGDPDSGGIAALAVIEELSDRLRPEELIKYYRQAEELLVRSQHPRINVRLGESARRVLSLRDNSAAQNGKAVSDVPENLAPQISLEVEVLRYEGALIRKALEASNGSVTRAARLLGVTHQGLAFIINGRHSDLLAIRTPVKKRRKSIIRYH
jgi:tetratricopeptide (TPR) repeat protein